MKTVVGGLSIRVIRIAKEGSYTSIVILKFMPRAILGMQISAT